MNGFICNVSKMSEEKGNKNAFFIGIFFIFYPIKNTSQKAEMAQKENHISLFISASIPFASLVLLQKNEESSVHEN